MSLRNLVTLLLIIIIALGGLLIALPQIKKIITPTILAPIDSKLPNQGDTSTTYSAQNVEVKLEPVIQNVSVPWSIVWTSPERMLFTERNGALREAINGNLTEQPLLTFPEVVVNGEQGLMGLAVDPNYNQNRYVYIARAKPANNTFQVDVIRLIDQPSGTTIDKVLVEKVPAGNNHAGTRLKIGPDQKLYMTTGDALQRSLAQERTSLAGKILRYNLDGTVPSDNPYPNSPVWSLGHRNPQGIAWDTRNNNLWETEHGSSGFDGPGGGDEVNLIQKGANYGWPSVSHTKSQAGLIDPAQVYTPAVAPASMMFYDADLLPQYKNKLFFGALRGEGIYMLTLDQQDPTKIISSSKVEQANDRGRIREVTLGPDGAIYFSTSNKDGRGTSKLGDDQIYKLTKKD